MSETGFQSLKISYKEEDNNTVIVISGTKDLPLAIAVKAISYLLAYVEENELGKAEAIIEELMSSSNGSLSFFDKVFYHQEVHLPADPASHPEGFIDDHNQDIFQNKENNG